MSEEVLKESFISALKSTKISDILQVLEDKVMADEMFGKFINEPTIHLKSFVDYL
jgi:hypothetical protein